MSRVELARRIAAAQAALEALGCEVVVSWHGQVATVAVVATLRAHEAREREAPHDAATWA